MAGVEREEVEFVSGGSRCAAWLYRPRGESGGRVPCVVMAHGYSFTRHDGLPALAQRFAAAGLAVLVFDHRFFGDSEGQPRQHFRRRAQLEDWRRAVSYARGLVEVDPDRVVLWGYSFSAGHAITLALGDDRVAAILVLSPFVDGLRRVLATPPRLTAWILPRALADLAGRHNVIPVTAPPGERGVMSFPGESDGFARMVEPESPWRNEISPGIFATVALYRPVRRARRIRCPLWVGLGERDISTDSGSVERLAARAPDAELHRYDFDHFDAFVGEGPIRVADDQLDFLARRGIASPVAASSAP